MFQQNRAAETGLIGKIIIEWSLANPRDLPWKNPASPYHIYVSEILLQQTRVGQAMPYYFRFLEQFPNIIDLAAASEDQVFKVWEGLGYYSRARNLMRSAKIIRDEYGGKIPSTKEALMALPGVGPYTAAAVASFAYGERCAVLDGNVKRLLARLHAERQPIDEPAAHRRLQQLAESHLADNDPALFNQAIMDFGALVCTPRTPACTNCPLESHCHARAKRMVDEIPVRIAKVKRKTRYFYYLVVEAGTHVYVRKRAGSDIWRGLYEFFLIEAPEATMSINGLIAGSQLRLSDKGYPVVVVRQILTHQVVQAAFVRVDAKVSAAAQLRQLGFEQVEKKKIRNFALPGLIVKYMQEHPI